MQAAHTASTSIRMCLVMLSTGLTLVAGCATVTPKTPEPAPSLEPLASIMGAADKAHDAGQVLKAREGYRSAATAYPSEPMPWVRLAHSHFQGGEYANAIVAAEEALQRNPHDQIAMGITAVSGLRVTTRALAHLNDKQSLGDSRAQAEAIVSSLRTVLGEPSLLVRETDNATLDIDAGATRPPGRSSTRISGKSSAASQKTPTAIPLTVQIPTATATRAPVVETPTQANVAATSTTPRSPVKKSASSSNPLELLR